MPLTAKGNDILEAMRKEYGKEEGERIFYASRNSGVISGVDSEYELEGKSVFNLDNMAEQISSLGSEAKRLAERMDAVRFSARALGEKYARDGKSEQDLLFECKWRNLSKGDIDRALAGYRETKRGDAERMDGSFEDAAFQLGMKHGEAGLPMIDYKKIFDAEGAEAYEKGYKGGQRMRRK